jgi:hypothetical protein
MGMEEGKRAIRPRQGDHPTTGRPQGCAPTMLRIALPGSSIVGAMACPRPVVGLSPCSGTMRRLAIRPNYVQPSQEHYYS